MDPFPRRWWAALPPLVFVLLFLVRPLAAILGASFAGTSLAQAVGTVVGNPYLRGRFVFSAYEAVLSTVLTLLVGLPVAALLSTTDLPGARVLRSLITVPFVLPPIVVALALLTLLGPTGAVNGLLATAGVGPLPFVNTLAAILVAHVFYNVALVVRIVGSAWAHLDPRLGEAAATLGASPRQRALRVTAPLLLPPILAASLLVFLFSFTSFGIILILAGQFHYYTVEATVWYMTRAFRPSIAAVLAAFQALFTLAVMTVYARSQERASVTLPLASEAHVREVRPGLRGPALAAGLLVVALVAAPMVSLVVRSLQTPGGWGLGNYAALTGPTTSAVLVPPPLALRNSLVYASTTAVLALLLGGLVAAVLARARGRGSALVDAGFMLPLGVSAVTLGLGLTLAYGRYAVDPLLGAGVIVVAHTLIAYPFATRILLAAVRGIDPGLRDAASTLGATPLQVLRRVDLPLLAPALAVAAVFAFAVSMGEFGATMLLRRPDTATLPIAVFELFGRPGAANYGRALAMAVVLMAVNLVAFLVIERFRPAGSEF